VIGSLCLDPLKGFLHLIIAEINKTEPFKQLVMHLWYVMTLCWLSVMGINNKRYLSGTFVGMCIGLVSN